MVIDSTSPHDHELELHVSLKLKFEYFELFKNADMYESLLVSNCVEKKKIKGVFYIKGCNAKICVITRGGKALFRLSKRRYYAFTKALLRLYKGIITPLYKL